MSRIEYKDICPECQAVGTDANLGYDLGSGQFSCLNGHSFAELPVSVVPTEEKNGESVPTKQAGIGQEEAENGGKQAENEAENPEFLPGPIAELEGQNQPEAENGARVDMSARLASIMAARGPGQVQEVQPAADGGTAALGVALDVAAMHPVVRANDTIKLPDGSVLVGLVIPEAWAQAVEAEAETQGRSAALYLRDWLTSEELRSAAVDWLANYWCAAAGQTV